MNFISSVVKSAGGQFTDEPEKAAGEESGGGSTTELVASAVEALAEVAESHINKDGANVDNKKVAEAAADVLDAAQKYGKLDETQGVGQCIEKTETYLHQYGSGSATEKPPTAVMEETKAPPAESAPVAEGDHEEEEKSGGAGYLKMADDFLGKE